MRGMIALLFVLGCDNESHGGDGRAIESLSALEQVSVCQSFFDNVCMHAGFESFCSNACHQTAYQAAADNGDITAQCGAAPDNSLITVGQVNDCANTGDMII